MQRPEEYKRFFNYFSPQEIGVNLNIGHLNLAAKAFQFNKRGICESGCRICRRNGIES